jgi:hypothetical protein
MYSEYKGNIYNVNTANDTIDMGICHVQDSISTEFNLESLGNDSLFLPNLNLFYFHSATANDPNGIFRFFFLNEPPFSILPNSLVKYKLQFNSKSVSENEGKSEMKLKMILSKRPNPISLENDSVYGREFIVIARKTNKYIAGYDSYLNFDSVFVNTSLPLKKDWFVKNVWENNLKVHKDKFELLTSKLTDDEIVLKNKPTIFPLDFTSKKNNPSFEFEYKPLNKGEDSARYILYYHTDEKNISPDTLKLDSTQVTIRGVGIEQKLSYIMLSNHNINYDTQLNNFVINVGNLKVNDLNEIKFLIKNDGNFNFGAFKQSILNSRNDEFVISDSLISNRHLKINEVDTFSFKIKPKSFGKIDGIITLYSDIIKRKISGYQKSDEEIKINITGYAIEPKLSISTDTLNFGNVSKSDSCPNFKKLILKLKNNGNDDLELKDIYFERNSLLSFSYNSPNPIIAVGKEENIQVTFQPNDLFNYNSNLVIVTNQAYPKDTVKVNLIGRGTEQLSAELLIDSIWSAPGRTIEIPIKVNKDKVQLANRFEDILLFNTSLLDFQSLVSNNTSCDGLSIGATTEKRIDGIHLILKRQNDAYFLDSDTLIILKFKTYLGNAESSFLTFSNPKFADNFCPQVLKPILSKGFFSLDSVCGLDKKIGELPKGYFQISNVIFNNLNKSLKCQFELPFKCDVVLNLYNIDGIKVLQKDQIQNQIGINEIDIEKLDLPIGVYLLNLQSGIFNSNIQIVVYE